MWQSAICTCLRRTLAAQPLCRVTSGVTVTNVGLFGSAASQRSWHSGFIRASPVSDRLVRLASTTTVVEESPQSRLFSGKPCSLEVEDDSPSLDAMPAYQRLALRIAGYHSRESQLIRGAEKLYKEIVYQSTNDEIFSALKLEKDFRAEFALKSLHIWLCLARLREEGKEGKEMSQALYDIFWEDVERRVYAAGVKVRVSKWLKELEEYFFGSSVAYDNALKGDSKALDEAVFRNVYGSQGNKTDAALLATYLRRERASLHMTNSEAVFKGCIRFSRDYQLSSD